jgi:hypothetical protein
VCERTHLTMSTFEHISDLKDTGAEIPEPGSAEATALLSKSTCASRQWAARRTGAARPADALLPRLLQIEEPPVS